MTMTPMEQAMQWERMSGERLSDADRAHVLAGGQFVPPNMRTNEQQVTNDNEPVKPTYTPLVYQISEKHIGRSDNDTKLVTALQLNEDGTVVVDWDALTHMGVMFPLKQYDLTQTANLNDFHIANTIAVALAIRRAFLGAVVG